MLYLSRYQPKDPVTNRRLEHELGRKLLRKGLIKEYGRDWKVETAPGGKPFLLHAPDIFFNISHTEGLVACLIDDKPVGIDVERIRPCRQSVMKRICSGEEIDWILGQGEPGRKDEYITKIDKGTGSGRTEMDFRFFSVWTLKESYGKALGTGLAMPMNQVSLIERGTGKPKLSLPDWCFWQRTLGEWILSVCFQQNTESVYKIPQWNNITIWEDDTNEF